MSAYKLLACRIQELGRFPLNNGNIKAEDKSQSQCKEDQKAQQVMNSPMLGGDSSPKPNLLIHLLFVILDRCFRLDLFHCEFKKNYNQSPFLTDVYIMILNILKFIKY